MTVARTVKLTIAYDGTDFAGWQRQTADRTVQATIEDALAPIEGGPIVITGSGRTDAGVHAVGQVASVSLESTIANDTLQRALNATLPPDVRIMRVEDVPAGFNARFDARQKTYHYTIYSGTVLPPMLRRQVWHVKGPLDADGMNAAAALLIGTHDFAAFQASGGEVATTVRELTVSRVTRAGAGSAEGAQGADVPNVLLYEVTGSGFLRHMVRTIVGTLVDVGRGRRRVDDMHAILASGDRGRASATAPAQGLTLWEVEY
jgi:tRNA pseudouridine38-40 synthase